MNGVEPKSPKWNVDSVEAHGRKYRTWGQWGPDDEIGAGNRVTPATVRRASDLIVNGTVFSLALPLDQNGPQSSASNRANPHHVMLTVPSDPPPPGYPRQNFSDDAVYLPLQTATQWDALSHFYFDGKTYNDRGADSVTARSGALHSSITGMSNRAVGRGVLLDIARWMGRNWLNPGEAIQADDLQSCADDQGVTVGEADFVLVRTGQLAQVRHTGAWRDYAGGDAPGLGVSAADFLCPKGVTAVATDTWGIEAKPYESPDVLAPLHVVLLVNAGIYIGEMWDLEDLAEDCARDGVYEFFLVAQPLTITGSVGSPINPIAIK